MFQNNNKAIVKKLTKRSLTSDKRRNFFIVMAIALTTFLIGSVFSIGMSLMESIQINHIRFIGTVAHAAVGHPTSAQVEQLNKLDYVKAVGTGNNVGYVENTPQIGKINLELHYFDKTEWEVLRSPAYVDIEGEYPQKENEIMVSRWLLEKLGIDNPSVGMQILLTYYTESGNSDKLITGDFRLSGWFTNYSYIKSLNTADVILVSQALSQKHGKTVKNDGSATVMFDNSSRVMEYCDTLVADLGLSEDQPIALAETYDTDDGQAVTSMIALCSIAMFFVLTGYLLIYNVLYISVSRDVRFYGLLKTLGTTPKQIKGIVTGQIIRLCMIGIPIGLIFSLLLSLIFLPVILLKWEAVSTEPVVSFSPVIYLGAVIFALLTAFLGAMKPAKKAAGISPIEAQKYTGAEVKKNRVHSSSHGKPYRMAFRNIFRDKKRAGVVLLSLFLGVTTFTTVTTLVLSININGYIESMYESDFSLRSHAVREQKFDSDYIEKLESLPGFENLSITTWEIMTLDYSPDVFGEYIADFCEKENIRNFTEEYIHENFHGFLLGVDSDIFIALNKKRDNPIDVDAFERGEIALIATENPSLFANVQELSISPRYGKESSNEESGGNEKVELLPGGFVPFNFRDTGSGLAPTLIVSNTLMNKLYADPIISNVNLNVSDGYDEQALLALKQIMGEDDEISCVSKIEAAETFNNAKIIMYVLGGGIALVIAFIGILNFVNVMSVSVMVRKLELATLESIGMSRKQIKKLLISEGLGYAIITLFFVLSAGNAITYCIFKLFQYRAVFATFTYPFIPMTIVILIILAVCFATPQILYRSVNKSTIVERLREAE